MYYLSVSSSYIIPAFSVSRPEIQFKEDDRILLSLDFLHYPFVSVLHFSLAVFLNVLFWLNVDISSSQPKQLEERFLYCRIGPQSCGNCIFVGRSSDHAHQQPDCNYLRNNGQRHLQLFLFFQVRNTQILFHFLILLIY